MAHPMEFSCEQIERLRSTASHAELAREFGCTDMPIRRWRVKNHWTAPTRTTGLSSAFISPSGPLGTPGISSKDGESTVTSPPIEGGLQTRDAEGYLRERWGFPVERWICVSAVGNEWQGGDGEGGAVTYAQVKGSFRPIADLAAILPAPAKTPSLTRARRITPTQGYAHEIVVLTDHQAPYTDDALHQATLAMIAERKPARLAHLGDLCDYTNISKHKDHSHVKASVDDCTQAGVDILADLRSVAPDAQFEILEGNHDIRPLSELLLRAERMAGIRAGDLHDGKGRTELLSTRALWRLDDLGIDLVADPRGWQHAELDLVPGPYGLAAVHGHLTSDNVARRTLAKVGRSVLLGHTHRPEHVFQWSQQLKCEQQAMVVGAQCAVRGDKLFPTFVARDGWLQGPTIVTVHPDGEFALTRCRWTGTSLIAGQQRWTP